MMVTVVREQEVLREAVALRTQLFEGESVATLFEKVRAYQQREG